MNSVLILDPDASVYLQELARRNLPDLEIVAAENLEQAAEQLPRINIMFGQPALIAEALGRAERLEWVQSTFAGVEQLCRGGMGRNYVLTGIKNLFGSFMREYVFAYILARERSLLRTYANQQKRIWSRLSYRSLSDTTIGIVGLGSIGVEIAKTARHFGMRVLGMKRTRQEIDCVDRLFLPAELDDFLPQLDYLVLVLPDTPQSRNFIAARELRQMHDQAVLINVGRGVSVNEHDLIAALETKQIGGAILDVFATEPLPDDSPLWSMDQVIITPHNSAYSFPDQVAEIFCTNYLRFVENMPLTHVVDFNRGY